MTIGKSVGTLAHSAIRAVITFQLVTYIVIYYILIYICIYGGREAFKSIAIILKRAINMGEHSWKENKMVKTDEAKT